MPVACEPSVISKLQIESLSDYCHEPLNAILPFQHSLFLCLAKADFTNRNHRFPLSKILGKKDFLNLKSYNRISKAIFKVPIKKEFFHSLIIILTNNNTDNPPKNDFKFWIYNLMIKALSCIQYILILVTYNSIK